MTSRPARPRWRAPRRRRCRRPWRRPGVRPGQPPACRPCPIAVPCPRLPSPPRTADGPPLRQLQLGPHLLEFALRRSTRRSIGFMIDDNGLRVTAPKRVTLAEIDNAIRAKQGWIISKLQERGERKVQRQQRAPVVWVDGAVLPYLGGEITLRLHQAPRHRASFQRDTGELHVWVTPAGTEQQLKEKVKAWFQQRGAPAVRGAAGPVRGKTGRALRFIVAVLGRHALGQLHRAAKNPPELAIDPLRPAAGRLRGGARTVAPAGNEPQCALLGHGGVDLSRLRWRQAGLAKTLAGTTRFVQLINKGLIAAIVRGVAPRCCDANASAFSPIAARRVASRNSDEACAISASASDHQRGAAGFDRLLGHQRKIEGMRADQHRFAQRCRLDQVLPAQRQQAAADKGAVAGRIIRKHLAHRVAQQHPRGWRHQPVLPPGWNGAARPGRARRPVVPRRRNAADGAARSAARYSSGRLARVNASRISSSSPSRVLAHSSTGRWPTAARSQAPVASAAAGTTTSNLMLPVTATSPHAQLAHARGVVGRLRRHQRDGARGLKNQLAQALRLLQRTLRQARIGQHHRHAVALALVDQVRPHFGFHQNADARRKVADKARRHGARVVRQIALHQARAMPGEQRLAGGAAGGGHVGQHDAAVAAIRPAARRPAVRPRAFRRPRRRAARSSWG